ncbi:hypothetical protein niasHS_001934 [Heterodera schachtii]|uniref:Uncharacterized protein n=1 Tax=Heterodera schachtii TaxID=97005 RepID=A0ABD2KAQ4_HETSC
MDNSNSIKKAFEGKEKPNGVEECKLIKSLEEFVITELISEELDQFADGKRERHNLATKVANLLAFKEKLSEISPSKPNKNEVKQLMEKSDIKIEQTIQLWNQTNAKTIGESDQKMAKEILEMKIKFKLIEMIQKMNFNTTFEHEKMVKECATAEKWQNWGDFVTQSHKMILDKFFGQINQSIGTILSEDWPSEQKVIVEKAMQSLNKIKMGQIPSEDEVIEVKSQFDELLSKNATNLDWQNVPIYDLVQISNWQLAIRSFGALSELFKNGIGQHNAKSEANRKNEGKKKKHQQKNGQKTENNGQGEEHGSNIFEQWLNDNAQLVKSVYDRLFPEDVLKQLQKKRRRRRKIDWEAWLQCISLILLFIIIIWVIIAFFLLAGSKSGGGRSRYRSRSSSSSKSSSSSSSNNRSYGYGGRSSYGRITAGRPTLTYWSSCQVVWYDLRNNDTVDEYNYDD